MSLFILRKILYLIFFWCAWVFHRDFRFVEVSFGMILYIFFIIFLNISYEVYVLMIKWKVVGLIYYILL